LEEFDMNKCVFLDRDGTINKENRTKNNPFGFMWDMSDLSLIKGVSKGIALLNKAGYKTVVITNQSGIARGFFNEGFVKKVHNEIDRRIAKKGAHIDRWYYCPHHPTCGMEKYKIECNCRKPKTGLVEKAVTELNISLENSFFVGDNLRDMETGWNSGIKTILVLTGNGKKTLKEISKEQKNKLNYIALDLLEACEWILNKVT